MNSAKYILGIEQIVDNYEIFILDQWGVMHDGKDGYYHAIECVESIKKKNKILVIISNSSKRKKDSKNSLPLLGFDSSYFDEVMTSGEMIWQALANTLNNYGNNLKKFFYMCDESDENASVYLQGLNNIEAVQNISEADFILACTPYSKFQPLDYVPLLEKAYKKNILMFCANPDFETVEKDAKNKFCMGTIAQLYEDLGGRVIILGKPSKEIYLEATKEFVKIPKNKIIAVGDSIFHDVKGANNFGIDSVLITTGIHSKYFSQNTPVWQDNKNKLLKERIVPTYIANQFAY